MRLFLSRCLFILIFSVQPLFAGSSCTVVFSMADFSTIYDQIRYGFIPFSTLDPKNNGGGQFFLKSGASWVSSSVTRWKTTVSVVASQSSTCDVVYSAGLASADVSYADVSTSGNKVPPTSTSGVYCLTVSVAAPPGSQTITIPQFGPNNGYWQPCS